MKLAGKTALITGAASGIGAEVARTFEREGAVVALVDRDGEGLHALTAELKASRIFEGDVADSAFVTATVAQLPRIDIVLTAAGMSVGKKLGDTTEEEWDRVFAVNAKGTFLWLRAVLPGMVAGGGGSIITVASQIALSGGRGSASDGASKGAVLSMTRSVALDYAADKVRANAIVPGAIDTPFLRRSFVRQPDPEAARQRSLDRHPMGRFGTVEEIAKAALFLASDDSSFTTGSVLMVEGGWNAA
ncbi:MAG: SDR family oxidoreductase [Alphaproteobacteria bacterium]|nr:SDR family oxidoreductase [Alphaproteobacteria bacterium]